MVSVKRRNEGQGRRKKEGKRTRKAVGRGKQKDEESVRTRKA